MKVLKQPKCVATMLVLLTPEQHKKLLEALEFCDDCGPDGEGWRSAELSDAIAALQKATTFDAEVTA